VSDGEGGKKVAIILDTGVGTCRYTKAIDSQRHIICISFTPTTSTYEMPTVQIATFLASDEFVANPEIFRAPVDVIKTTDGHIG
jgi:hypothetical protein